jgi:competence transcription factor ComK
MINNMLLTAEKPLKVRIDKIENSKAQLWFSDNQTIEINVKYLPQKASVGDMIYLSLVSDEELGFTKKQIATELLDQILH